ncbi:hypothetical protein BDZ97DRAFT_1858236 [Flammula alnicola]|nr:hypothetical protein BDZ97DRAFT_1858236 [Flammula alnicola]
MEPINLDCGLSLDSAQRLLFNNHDHDRNDVRYDCSRTMTITITIDTVQQALLQLGLSDKLDSSTLYQALERQALKENIQTTRSPPPLDPQQRTTLVSAARSMTSGEPVPPYSSKAAPASLDAREVAKRRNLVQRAKSDFKGTIPMTFVIMSPPSS